MTSDAPEPPHAPQGAPRIICIGGGRGGVGKSVLTVNVAVYLAQLGRDVVVCDADPAGAGLPTMFGIDTVPTIPAVFEMEDATPLPTLVPRLRLSPPAYDPSSGALMRPGKKAKWLSSLRNLPVDYVLLDLGAGNSHVSLDLFLAADIGVCVSTPEPPAIEATYRFVRALFLRKLRRTIVKDRFKMKMLERACAELPPLPSPLDLIATLTRYDRHMADLVEGLLPQVKPRLCVSQTRVRTDLDLGPAMRTMVARYLGIDLDYLGHVEHDDAVWLTIRRKRPLLVDSPTTKAGRNLERIARRILALATSRDRPAEEPLPPPAQRMTLYELLGVPRGASDEEVRRAYKREKELFAPGSMPLTSLLWGDKLAREQSRIEEAHDTLLDSARRRSYDLSTFPDDETKSDVAPKRPSQGQAAELSMLQAELAAEINPETQFTGALLRKVRESLGVELTDISSKTKITNMHLKALEEEAFGELPALVYTRGFVQEVAKFLKLDPSQVSRTYLRRMREALSGRGNA